MGQNNNNNMREPDATSDVISWVVVIILLFAFPPIGLLLLILKMRSTAKPAQDSERWADARSAGAARVDAARREAPQTGASRQNTTDFESAVRKVAQETGNAARQFAQETGNTARQFAQDAGVTARQVAQEAGNAARKAAQEIESAARQFSSEYGGAPKNVYKEAVPDISLNFSGYQKTAKDKKKKRSKLDKKSGRFLSVVLLLVSIVMFIIGVTWLSLAAQNFSGGGQIDWFHLFMGVSTFVGAVGTFFSRNIGVRRISRYKNYYAFTAGRDIVPMSDIARASGLSVRAATRDIQAMINAQYFDSGAYIDSELDCLVLRAGAAEELRRAARAEVEAPSPSDENLENQYMTVISELRELNYSIADVTISEKVDRIEELTAKIFRIVEENPEKKPQIRRFMSYYLPTTFKLLRSYSTLEKQGVKGENIMAAKENIGRILDTLATGFEQQLDQLFQADAIDIAADINVLENLMQQDGLTGEKSEFRTMTSGG